MAFEFIVIYLKIKKAVKGLFLNQFTVFQKGKQLKVLSVVKILVHKHFWVYGIFSYVHGREGCFVHDLSSVKLWHPVLICIPRLCVVVFCKSLFTSFIKSACVKNFKITRIKI